MQTYLIITIVLISLILAIIIIIVIIKRNVSIKENKIFDKKTLKNHAKSDLENDKTSSKYELNFNRIHDDINKLKSTFKSNDLPKSETSIIEINEANRLQNSSIDFQNRSKFFSSQRKSFFSRNFDEQEKTIKDEIKTKFTNLNEKDHLTTLTKSNTKRSFQETCKRMRTNISSLSIIKQ